MTSQGQVPKNVPTDVEPEKELEEEEEDAEYTSVPTVPPSLKHQSLALRPLTFGNWNWMFDAVAELTKPSTFDPPPPIPNNAGLSVPELAYLPPGTTKKRNTLTSQLSRLVIPQTQTTRPPLPPLQLSPRRPSSAMFPNTPMTVDSFPGNDVLVVSRKSRRFSAPGPTTPTSATFTVVDRDWEVSDTKKDYGDSDAWWERQQDKEEEEEFEKEKKAIARSGSVVHEKRRKMSRGTVNVKVVSEADEKMKKPTTSTTTTTTGTQGPPSFFGTTLRTLPTIPSKPLFAFALLICTLSGLMTPVFSYLLSRLLFEVSEGGSGQSLVRWLLVVVVFVCGESHHQVDMALGDGYDTAFGTNGGLSGGQAQGAHCTSIHSDGSSRQ
jgi:ATP-binding cassette subfamily B (MDR/TAP) protein 1